MFASGELQRLIDLGLRGMTSNPTIFEKAIGSGSDYDEQLRGLVDEHDPTAVFEALAIRDIRSACDLFRSVWDQTGGLDGYVSLEVSPTLANDTQGTIAAAQRLWNTVDRPNVMIKIPGTAAGIPAIKASIAAGININVTLLFSVDRYEASANAYIEGLEERAARGESIDRIASVASVFVSRIDSAVDKQLQAKIDRGESLQPLLGKAAIASTKLTYQRFLKLFGGDRFAALKAKGAHVQRPLWASTSTKNPAYPDLMYVDSLVGKDTVNTVPPNTLEALLEHGVVRPDTVLEGVDRAHAEIEALAKAQISLYDITETLVADGVKSFADSFNAMLAAITGKLDTLRAGTPARVALALGAGSKDADAALDRLADMGFLNKLWTHDTAPWSTAPEHVAIIKHALGWVEIAQQTHAQSGELHEFAQACAKRFDHVVVLGMGGSSLAPDILRATFGRTAGYPALHVLDSTDPQQIRALDQQLDISRSLFVVASKSGTTTEPDAFFRYFYQRRAADRRRQQRGRSLHRDHRSRHLARERSEGNQVPARLHQRPEHRRPLLGALVFRDGSGGAGRIRRRGDPRSCDQRDARERADGRRPRRARRPVRCGDRLAGEKRPRQAHDPDPSVRARVRRLGGAVDRRVDRQIGDRDRTDRR